MSCVLADGSLQVKKTFPSFKSAARYLWNLLQGTGIYVRPSRDGGDMPDYSLRKAILWRVVH